MRRGAVVLAVVAVAALLPGPAPDAATGTTDVYRSHFLARDRGGHTYSIDALVEDRPAGAQIVLEIRRRCASCRADVYAKTLGPGDVLVAPLGAASPECQCISASVTTKFGGKTLRLEWRWDVEQHSGPADGGYEWAAVTANTLLNVSCFGTGSFSTTPDPFSGDAPEPPKGAKKFPKEMPRAFRADLLARPGCHVDSP